MSYNENIVVRTNFIEQSRFDLNQIPEEEEEDDENRLIDNNIPTIGEEIEICRKGRWTRYEDEKLKEVVFENGPYNWKLIASKIEGRSGMSCRSRWFNYLDSSINRREFSELEESMLILAQRMYGNQWALIASQFPGRTDISLKNRWRKLMARISRENNSFYRPPGRRPYGAPGAQNLAVTNVGPNNGGEELMTTMSYASDNLPFFDFMGIGN